MKFEQVEVDLKMNMDLTDASFCEALSGIVQKEVCDFYVLRVHPAREIMAYEIKQKSKAEVSVQWGVSYDFYAWSLEGFKWDGYWKIYRTYTEGA